MTALQLGSANTWHPLLPGSQYYRGPVVENESCSSEDSCYDMGECYIEQLMMTALRRGAILLGICYLPRPQCYREPAVEDESCSFDDV